MAVMVSLPGKRVLSFTCIIFIWYTCSTLVNIAWKRSHVINPYKILLTCIQFAIAEVIILPVILMSTDSSKTVASMYRNFRNPYYLIIGVAFAFGQLCTNVSLSIISVSSTHVIKIAEPVIAVFLGITILKEKLSKETVLWIICILMGVAISTVTDETFRFQGLIFAALSNLMLQVRNLFIKLLKIHPMQNEDIDAFVLYIVSNTVGFIILSTLSVLYGLFYNYDIYAFLHLDYNAIILGVSFAGQHIASYFILQQVYITTHALLNVVKRVVVIVICSIIMSKPLNALQMLGISIAIFGFYCYTTSLSKDDRRHTLTKVPFGSQYLKSLTKVGILTLICIILAIPVIHNMLFFKLGSNNFYMKNLLDQNVPKIVRSNDSDLYMQSLVSHTISQAKKPSASIIALWAYNRDIDDTAKALLTGLGNKRNNVTVLCSTLRCQTSVNIMNLTSIQTMQLKVFEVTDGTIISSWIVRHALMKILYGPTYESNLQKALQLALLWKIGNIVIDLDLPFSNVRGFVETIDELENDTCILSFDKCSLGLCNLRSKHPFIQQMMRNFLKQTARPVHQFYGMEFSAVLKQTLSEKEFSVPQDITEKLSGFLGPFKKESNDRKFGILAYDTANLGDEAQSIASAHFLPRVDYFLLRDGKHVPIHENVTMIMNAFWPIWKMPTKATNIHPILVAIHIWDEYQSLTEEFLIGNKDYYTKHGVVGARDSVSMNTFLKLGIPAKLSGCLTPFIQNPFAGLPRNDMLYFVDIPEVGKQLIPLEILQKGEFYSHTLYSYERGMGITRFPKMYELLEIYAQAKLVVTIRLHVALPCIALGTPVIFLNLRTLYGATSSHETARVSGLTELFHTVDMFKMSMDEARAVLRNFNWTNPPPNPNPELADMFRKTAWSILSKNEDIQDVHNMYSLRP